MCRYFCSPSSAAVAVPTCTRPATTCVPRALGSLTQKAQFEFAHRSLEPEQQAIVAEARIVDTVGVDHDRADQPA